MIDNQHIGKGILLFFLAAILTMFGFLFYESSAAETGSDGLTMTYESTLFDTSSVIAVDISISEDSWTDLLENAADEEYYDCSVTVNGTTYKHVGLRAKGNTSLSMVAASDSDRYSFKIKFDEYVDGQSCDGLSKLVLNNNYSDATMMKEALCYDMFAFLDADASLYNYARVSVNGEYWGVYLALEPVEESFASRNYGTDYGQFYKPDSMEMGGAGKMKDFSMDEIRKDLGFDKDSDLSADTALRDSNQADAGSADKKEPPAMAAPSQQLSGSSAAALNYIDDEPASYETIWDGSVFQSSDSDHRRVITALKNICAEDADTASLSEFMDVDNVLRYMAVQTFVVNLDSLTGSMAHNYYLYEEDGKLNIIPWDYNLAFGGFQSGSASETINFPIDTPFSSGVSLEDRQFFMALLENETYLAQYHSYLAQLTENYVKGDGFESFYSRVSSQIDELVKEDPTSFYTYEEYTAAKAMLRETLSLRAESVLGQLAGTIPSTRDGQTEDSSSLIDSSSIDLSVMGVMNGGTGGKPEGFFGDSSQGGKPEGFPGSGNQDSKPDGNGQNDSSNGFPGGFGERDDAGETGGKGSAPPGASPPDGAPPGGGFRPDTT